MEWISCSSGFPAAAFETGRGLIWRGCPRVLEMRITRSSTGVHKLVRPVMTLVVLLVGTSSNFAIETALQSRLERPSRTCRATRIRVLVLCKAATKPPKRWKNVNILRVCYIALYRVARTVWAVGGKPSRRGDDRRHLGRLKQIIEWQQRRAKQDQS